MLNGTANTVLPSLRRLQVGPTRLHVIEPVDLAISGRTADAATPQFSSSVRVASAFRSWSEARGSLLQLLLNIVVLIVVGVLTPRSVPLLWQRISNRHDQAA